MRLCSIQEFKNTIISVTSNIKSDIFFNLCVKTIFCYEKKGIYINPLHAAGSCFLQ